jgi:dihydrofolate synthase/folylpolyglutamate synthase
MNLRQAEDYLLGLELFGMRFGLDRMHRLMTVLGLPQGKFASIHVVGTNGKSSTARFCAAILEEHGLLTGCYTSPHLRSFRERIEVSQLPVGEEDFAAAVARAAQAAEMVDGTAPPDDRVTQFEALTAATYHELARRGVEVAVIEAGLGGRYDATNVIPSRVQVLTSVGLDHTRWLGSTITEIAEEKLAVVRDYATLVVGPLPAEAVEVARRVADARHATLVAAPPDVGVPLRALGRFQRTNFAIAAAAAKAFLGRALDPHCVERAADRTMVPGRAEVVAENPRTLFDGAHNPAGAQALAESLEDMLGAARPRVAVIGVLEDKDAAGMLDVLLPHFDSVVFTRSRNPRSLPPATLVSLAEKRGGTATDVEPDPRAAVERARALAGQGGCVVVTGSIYLIADLVRDHADARASSL